MIPAQRHAPVISALGREQDRQCRVLFVGHSEPQGQPSLENILSQRAGAAETKGGAGRKVCIRTLFLALPPPPRFSLICVGPVCVCAFVRTGRQALVEVKGKMRVLFLWSAVGFVWLFSDIGFSPSVLGCLSRELQRSACLCLSRTGTVSIGHPPIRQILTDSAPLLLPLLP